MNQMPVKPKTRPLAKPVVLPKRCAPPRALIISTVVTVTLLILSLMVLAVALLVGATETPERSGSSKKEKTQENEVVVDPRPKIAITFDDGPHNVRTKKIVDELNKYGYHATFFVVGNRVDGSEYSGKEAVQYAAANGNEIGIHGYTHSTQRYYDVCSEKEYQEEISKTYQAITSAVPSAAVTLMRPVGGRITAERTASSPYSVIMWDIDSQDWALKGRDDEAQTAENINTIVNNVKSQAHEGGIILMHDIYENTYEATVIILQWLNEEGYNVVSVSELLGETREAGKKYSSAQLICLPIDISFVQCYNEASKKRICEAYV